MPQKVIWHLRMNREGRTCLGCERTVIERGGQIFKVEVVRMQDSMVIEYMDKGEMVQTFPLVATEATHGRTTIEEMLSEAARQYLVHAANAGAPREVVDWLTKLYKPKAGLRARLDTMLAPKKPIVKEDLC